MARTRSEQQGPSPTRRAYYCGVVVEGGLEGQAVAQDVQTLVASLGEAMSGHADKSPLERSSSSPTLGDGTGAGEVTNGRPRALTTGSAFNDVLNELVATERSYVSKLQILKNSYADPLRKFARRKEEAILPAYEAKTLFGNIDAILPANEAFLADLEEMLTPNGPRTVGGIGDVALKHIRDLRAFDCYKQYYAKREEAQAIFEREMMKKASTGFAGFIDVPHLDQQDTPVNRRLSSLVMIKHMAPTDPQRAKLIEADELASKIALAETDEKTKHGAVMYCLERSIEGFPANLISSGRSFVDCIDVEDVPVDGLGPGYSGAGETGVGAVPLHCTLFLFDDCLLIVKRPHAAASGRSVSGLDEVERAIRTGGLPSGVKKGVMSCKGVMDVTEVVASDVGGSDFHLFLEQPPTEYSDRWANRPFRSYSVVHPPSPPNLDPSRARADKQRFLENLWTVQALYRTKDSRSTVLVSNDREMDGRKTLVRTFFNIYERKDWLKEPKKNKIILHVDPFGTADPLPFGMHAPPYVIARAQPMAGELCRYTVTSSDPNDEVEEDIVHTAAVPSRIVQTIHQFGLFKFRTGRNSMPSTPSASSSRSKAAIFGLDAISRNLFGSTNSARGGDVFGIGSITGSHRRTKSGVARSSTVTTTTASDGSLKFSHRSNSTAGTSFVSVGLDEDEPPKQEGPRKLVKRGRSPGGISGPESGSEMEDGRRWGPLGRKSSRRRKSEPSLEPPPTSNDPQSDEEMVGPDDATELIGRVMMDDSEWDLSMRLELARRNSRSQEANQTIVKLRDAAISRAGPIEEDVIMEGASLSGRNIGLPLTGAFLASSSTAFSMQAQSGSGELSEAELGIGDSPPQRSTRSFPESVTPTPSLAESLARSRNLNVSQHERKPMGPRSPTKSPPPRSVSPNLRPLSPNPSTTTRPTTPTRRQPSVPPPAASHPLPPVPPLPLSRVSSNPTIDELERAVSPTTPRRSLFETPGASTSASHALSSSLTARKPPPPLLENPSFPGPPPPLVPVNEGEASTIEPLAIKKKIIIHPSPSHRKTISSPLEKNSTARRLSAQARTQRQAAAAAATEALDDPPEPSRIPLHSRVNGIHASLDDRLEGASSSFITFAESTRDDIESSQRAVKRIKLEVESFRAKTGKGSSSKDPIARVRSPPPHLPRSPQTRNIANRAAEARMEEMRQMIQNRGGRSQAISAMFETASISDRSSTPPPILAALEEYTRNVELLADEASRSLDRAYRNQAEVQIGATRLVDENQQRLADVERLQNEVGRAKRQCELVKRLLGDATAENEIMYEAFNEELDGMFNDATLPETDAWQAMTLDLRRTKEERNSLAKENKALKRKLEEAELQNREWETLLRRHGLIL
ncbi:hypothetical protein FRB99_008714 [Tulasnella sp. 403]|nr:hypothetical protein FRB99_008714 [Tulasnella sp. 403]